MLYSTNVMMGIRRIQKPDHHSETVDDQSIRGDLGMLR